MAGVLAPAPPAWEAPASRSGSWQEAAPGASPGHTGVGPTSPHPPSAGAPEAGQGAWNGGQSRSPPASPDTRPGLCAAAAAETPLTGAAGARLPPAPLLEAPPPPGDGRAGEVPSSSLACGQPRARAVAPCGCKLPKRAKELVNQHVTWRSLFGVGVLAAKTSFQSLIGCPCSSRGQRGPRHGRRGEPGWVLLGQEEPRGGVTPRVPLYQVPAACLPRHVCVNAAGEPALLMDQVFTAQRFVY